MVNYKTDVNGNNAVMKKSLYEVLTEDTTLTYDHTGMTFGIGTDGIVITLPPTKNGIEFSFINIGAAGNNVVTIAPQEEDGIAGTITLADTAVTRVGTVNTALVNTKATSTLGNSVKIIGTGVAGTGAYIIQGSTGIWA